MIIYCCNSSKSEQTSRRRSCHAVSPPLDSPRLLSSRALPFPI